jgi:diadenosine tetraphosphate (Ap4A) HIT family hydrolase
VCSALEGSERVVLVNKLALCIADGYPVSEGHSLVIPRRHVTVGMVLHQPEWDAMVALLQQKREQLSVEDATISGWNMGLNSGEAAGQTAFYTHWHLIPRRQGNCEQPRGVDREVISAQQSY